MPDDNETAAHHAAVDRLAAFARRLPIERARFAIPACMAVLERFYDDFDGDVPRHRHAKIVNLASPRVTPNRERAS